MARELTRADVQEALARLVAVAGRPGCWSCECLQGLVTQLEMDAAEDVTDLTAPAKARITRMHGCLGCRPCPPGRLFTEYLQRPRE